MESDRRQFILVLVLPVVTCIVGMGLGYLHAVRDRAAVNLHSQGCGCKTTIAESDE